MTRTPDGYDGPRDEESVIWEEQSSDPAIVRQTQLVQDKGLVTLVDGAVRSIGETREAIWQAEVDEIDVDTPPGSPATGYRVIVGDSPTGVFVTHDGEIAQYDGSAWVYTVPRRGTIAYAKDANEPYKQTALSTPWVWVPSGSGITASEHETLRQLIHLAGGTAGGPFEGFATGAYRERLPSGSLFPTSFIWWESSGKTKKIVERTITWTGILATTDQWKVYDTDGSTVLATVTDTISYTGLFETSRTRAIA
jgi:Protein of unknown function (DUF2793)